MNNFQQKLKAVMAALNWNAPELARRSGLPLASIKSILQGRSKNPRSSTVSAISEACGYPLADLISPLPEINPSLLLKKPQTKRDSLAKIPAELTEEVSTKKSADEYSLPLFKKTLRAVEEASATVDFSLEGRDFFRHQVCTILYEYALERSADYGGKAVIDMVLAYWLLHQEKERLEKEAQEKLAQEKTKTKKNSKPKKLAPSNIKNTRKKYTHHD